MDRNEDVMREYIKTLCVGVAEEYSVCAGDSVNRGVKRGLRNEDGTGVLAGVTRIGSVQGYYVEDADRVPMPGQLYYRGISVEDIVEAHRENRSFGYEEVAYLLLLGRLPNAEQYEYFDTVLSNAQPLPHSFTEDIIMRAPSDNIMNMLSRAVLALYSYDEAPEDKSIENLMRQSIELIGRFPGMVATAHSVKRHRYSGKSLYIHNPKESLSVSENLLRMLRQDKVYTKDEALLLDMMLILHAEHGGGNNSAFTCRVLSSTGTDTYSAIAGAISSLKGPLHGGANAKVGEMFSAMKDKVSDLKDEGEIGDYLDRLLDKKEGDGSGKIYGLGHAVYTMSDPRAEIIKKHAREMARGCGRLDEFELIERVERVGLQRIAARKRLEVPMCANVDLYSGLIYDLLGIPEELYTPIFALARIAGWCAHRIEEVTTCGRIMRPAYRALIKKAPYIPMAERGI